VDFCGQSVPSARRAERPANPQTVICAIHRDPAIWPRAAEFVPERWLAGHAAEVTDAQRRAFNPWGDGARACIGRRFAAEEGRIVLLRLYQRCAALTTCAQHGYTRLGHSNTEYISAATLTCCKPCSMQPCVHATRLLLAPQVM
jgi:hypothetical protein